MTEIIESEMEAAKLTKEERDALPDSDFAVPRTRDMPMKDVRHTRMAWNMVDRTGGLTDDERSQARRRILRRAHELGMDTKNWNASSEDMEAAMNEFNEYENSSPMRTLFDFSAMAIEVPPVSDHPNRHPFKGVLTKLDEPSDAPIGGSSGGSRGKLVVMPKNIAEQALPSLLMMAVDFRNDLSGHDAKQKCGVITEAFVKGNELHVAGFLYAEDFPQATQRIKAERAIMGMSYEAQVETRPLRDGVLIVTSCIFTGAAILYKEKAAYRTTSFTASKADEEKIMTDQVLAELKKLGDRFDKTDERLGKLEASASAGTKLQANGLYSMVQPHANALHAAANEMCAAGIGNHPSQGHAAVIRNVANHMLAEAAKGTMPHVYQTQDWYDAEAKKGDAEKEKVAAAASADIQKENDELKARIKEMETEKFNASQAPQRGAVTAPAGGAAIAKGAAGVQLKKFDDFYAEAETVAHINDFQLKTAYALTKMTEQQKTLNANGGMQ